MRKPKECKTLAWEDEGLRGWTATRCERHYHCAAHSEMISYTLYECVRYILFLNYMCICMCV